MKLNFFSILSTFLLFFSSCHKGNTEKDIRLDCTINTFSAPVSAIVASCDNNTVYIGLDNGVVVKKYKDNNKSFWTGTRTRVYDIIDCDEHSFFVGMRDSGLKLLTIENDSCVGIKTYELASKSLNYAVYSMTIDNDANILYAGTSSGLFELDLTQDDATLKEIKFQDVEKSPAVNEVTYKNGMLYIASDVGLYTMEDCIDSTKVNSISFDKDTIFAVGDLQITKIYKEKNLYKRETLKKGKYYSYKKGMGRDEWILSYQSVLYKQGSDVYRCDLPNGISSMGRRITAIDDNFYYVAYMEELLAFPLHQNTSGIANSVIAVSGKSKDDKVYFITSDLRLHEYEFSTDENNVTTNSKLCGHINNLKIDSEIIRFIAIDDNLFLLATRKKLYMIEDNCAVCIKEYDRNDISALFFSSDNQKLYIGTRHYLGIVDYKGQMGDIKKIPISIENRIDTTELYVVGISKTDDGLMYVATLNKGLFVGKEKGRDDYIKVWESERYGTTFDLATSGPDVLLNTSSGIILNNDVEKLDFIDFRYVKSICSDVKGNDIFILNFNGLFRQSLRGSELEAKKSTNSQFCDLAFNKSRIAVEGEKAVLGCRSGLFLYNNDSLTPINITREKSSVTWYIVIVAIVIIVFGGYLWWQRRNKKTSGNEEIYESPTEIEDKLKPIMEAVYKNYKHSEVKRVCEDFVNDFPQLRKLSFMKKKGNETRYYITVLFLIQDINTETICKVLDIKDKSYVNKFRYTVRTYIEKLYKKEPLMNRDGIIKFLYDRVNKK